MEIEEKCRAMNDAWLKSGLPQKKFCQQNNISYSKFTTMRSTLIHAGLLPSIQPASLQTKKILGQHAFIPVKMDSQKSLTPKQVSNLLQTMIEIQLPYGVTLRIPVDGKVAAR